MKLHLNKSLLTAVLACFAATPALADYTWTGGDVKADNATEAWKDAANWDADTVPGNGPGTPGSNAWDKIIFNTAVTVTTPTLEGWAFKMDVTNGANVTTTVNKLQTDGGTCYITVGDASTLTLTKGTSASGNDGGLLDVTLTSGTIGTSVGGILNMALYKDKGGDTTTVHYGDITSTTAVGCLNLSSAVSGSRTYNTALNLNANIADNATSETTVLHEVTLATYSDVTFSTLNLNVTTTDSTFFNAGSSVLTASDSDVGKYSVVNNNGTITLYYVTGSESALAGETWTLSEGESATLSDQTFGTPARLTLSVSATEAAGDVAGYTIDSDYAVSMLKVEGGAAQLTIAENASFDAELTSIGEGASLSYTGAGDLVLHQDADISAVSSLSGKLTVKGATLSATPGNGQTFALNASEIVLTESATLQVQASSHDFTQKVTMDGGTVHVVDGSNTHFKFNGGIEVGSNGATISSQFDKHFDLNSAITGSGTLKLHTTSPSSWGQAKFYLDSSVANGVNLEVSDSILNIKANASFGNGTIKLISSSAATERQTSQVNLEKDITLKFTSDSVGIVNVNGHTLSMTPTGTTTEGFRFAGTGTINLTASGNASLTASTNEALQSTFTGTININTTNSHVGVVGSGQLFKADADGNYASLNFTSGASGNVFGIGPSFTESNALKIGNLTSEHSNIQIRGDWESGNDITRYLEVHQTLDDATFSGIFATAGGNRNVGLIKEGVGNLNLTGANTAAAKLVVNGGSVTLKDSGSWAGDIEVGADGTLAFNGTGKEIAASKNITFADGATLAVTGGDLTVNKALEISNISVNGALTVTGELGLRSYDVVTTVEGEDGETTTTTTTHNGKVTIANGGTLTANSETVKVLGEAESATITGTGKVSVATAGLTYSNADITVVTAETVNTAATLSASKLTVTGGGTVATNVADGTTNSFDASEGSVTVSTGSCDTATVENLTVGADKSASFATDADVAANVRLTSDATVAGTISADTVTVSGDAGMATFTAESGAKVEGSLTISASSGTLVLTTVNESGTGILTVDNTLTATLTSISLSDAAKSTINTAMAALNSSNTSASIALAHVGGLSISDIDLSSGSAALTDAQLSQLGITKLANVSYTMSALSMLAGSGATTYLTIDGTYTGTPGTLTETSVTGVSVNGTNIVLTVVDSLDGVTGGFNVIVGDTAWESIKTGMAAAGGIYQNATIVLTDGTNVLDWATAGVVTLNDYAGTGTAGEYYVAYIPEPATATLSLLALAALAARRRRK